MNNLFAVFIGGGVGSLARYGISEYVKINFTTAFPLATLVSNVLSCLILALTIYFLKEKISVQPTIHLVLIVGFCGGFSTFSSFSFETVELIKSGNFAFVVTNILVSVSVCLSLMYFILKN